MYEITQMFIQVARYFLIGLINIRRENMFGWKYSQPTLLCAISFIWYLMHFSNMHIRVPGGMIQSYIRIQLHS